MVFAPLGRCGHHLSNNPGSITHGVAVKPRCRNRSVCLLYPPLLLTFLVTGGQALYATQADNDQLRNLGPTVPASFFCHPLAFLLVQYMRATYLAYQLKLVEHPLPSNWLLQTEHACCRALALRVSSRSVPNRVVPRDQALVISNPSTSHFQAALAESGKVLFWSRTANQEEKKKD